MEEIKNIVKSLNIEEKKKELLISRKKLFNLKVQMSKLTFDRTVGLYGYYLDEMMYLILKSKNSSNTDIFNKIKKLETKAKELEIYDSVKEYGALRDEYFKTLDDSDYYKTINIDLREKLSELEIPNIYIEQSKYDYDKNIISKKALNEEYNKREIYLISPIYSIDSFRDFRHFYNKTSFHYLESLCEDYSFDINNKNLGKIKVRKI